MRKFTFLLVFLLLGFYLSVSSKMLVSAATYYVNINATGANNGSSWADAYASLQSALDAATSGDQIWIAKGTYKPSSAYGLGDGTARYYHFEMKEGVKIYGGFAGTESSVDERTNFRTGGTNETIMSGDLNGDDMVNGTGSTLAITGNSDNCFHVIYNPSALELTSAAVLDGMTITGGNAGENVSPNHAGGGMYNDHCSPILNNIIFRNNVAYRYGGGIYNYYSSPILSNTIFVKNLVSGNNGGGMSNNNSSPTLVNVVFSNNRANEGGGLDNFGSSPVLTNVTISGNAASSNSHGQGGGIYNYGSSFPVLKNCIVYGNTAITNDGNEIYIKAGTVTLEYCCYGNGSGCVYRAETKVSVYVQKVKFKHLGTTGKADFRYNINNGRYLPETIVSEVVWDNTNWLNNRLNHLYTETTTQSQIGYWEEVKDAGFDEMPAYNVPD